jgi:hypothetical protein
VTLLEKALAANAGKTAPDLERIELAAAWANSLISDAQAAEALGCTGSNACQALARIIRKAIAMGLIPKIEVSK